MQQQIAKAMNESKKLRKLCVDQNSFLFFASLGVYFVLTGLLSWFINQVGNETALAVQTSLVLQLIGDSILLTYSWQLLRQTSGRYTRVLKWLCVTIAAFALSHLLQLGWQLSMSFGTLAEVTQVLFALKQMSLVLTNIFLFGFAFAAIQYQRKNILIYQIIFDSLALIMIFGTLLWKYILHDWTLDLVSIAPTVWFFFLFDLLTLAGLIVLVKMLYWNKVPKQIMRWKLVAIGGVVLFCLTDFVSWYQNILWSRTQAIDFTYVWQLALAIMLFSQYRQAAFFHQQEVVEAPLTLSKQMRRTRYVHLVALGAIILLEFNLTMSSFILLLLITHYVATKYVYIYQENRDLLVQYEQVNDELEQLVLQRTQQLVAKNAELEHMTKFDTLTQLPNNRYLETYCQGLIYEQTPFALAFFDLDRFKTVNDWFGHHVGDELLIEVTKRVQAFLPEEAFFARQSSDEFIIICQEPATLLEQAADFLAIFEEPIQLQHHQIPCTVTLGVTMYPQHAKTYQELLKNGDMALHRAKAAGRNCMRVYEQADQRQLILEHSLKNTDFANQFELYYQPQISAMTEQLIGCEALIRWHHPTLGFINPLEFITLAEETGTIHRLGLWVIETAFQQMDKWKQTVDEQFIIAVNISPVQLCHPQFVMQVKQLLQQYDVVTQVEFELVETMGITNKPEAIRALHELSELGIRIAVDDFGTGYSSISYLKHFPVHKLKIARELVYEMQAENLDAKIVQGIIALAHNIDVTIIAEGVETFEHLLLLKQSGCEQIQGYYYSKPLPVIEFEKKYNFN